MTKGQRGAIALVAMCGVCWGVAEYRDAHPKSAALPDWIRGEFMASAERYAGRTVAVDSTMIRFSHGAGGADVLPIEWIEDVKDSRSFIHVLDLHVKDGDVRSTIRLIASAQDSSFRLQTMPDVAWRLLSDRDARAARTAARESGHPEITGSVGEAVAAGAGPFAGADPVRSDTVIGAARFADRDPAAQDELSDVVAACRRYGCRIGIRGLQASRFREFAQSLRALGADSVSLTAEPSANTTLAMLEIPSGRPIARGAAGKRSR